MVSKCVIPAGGKGTRMKPSTYVGPKEIIEVLHYDERGPMPYDFLINHVINSAYYCGLRDFLVIGGYKKESLINAFAALPKNINPFLTIQRDSLGLGHAILCAKGFIVNSNDKSFAVWLGDDLFSSNKTIKRMVSDYSNNLFARILVSEKNNPERYGVFKFSDFNGSIGVAESIIEKPTKQELKQLGLKPPYYCVAGFYILNSKVFDYLEQTEPGKKGEIQLTDALQKALSSGERIVCDVLEGERFDYGNQVDRVINQKKILSSITADEFTLLIKRTNERSKNFDDIEL